MSAHNPQDGYKLQNQEIRFEVTNLCNARCIMCPREKMTRPQGVLDMGLYTRILDEARSYGVSVVSLENYGEPFMDPFLFERAAYAKGKGMTVFTISNASLLNQKMAEKAVLFFDKIRFSVYGTTKDVYESIHVGMKYEQVIANINGLIEERNKRKSRTPRIEVYFLAMEQNQHQIEDFKKQWMGRVDGVAIWKPHNWGDGRKYRLFEKTVPKLSCGRPATGPIQVQWDGLVVPCCFDYNSNIVLGDLNRQSLYEVVTGPEYEKFRKAHAKKEFSLYPFCNVCDQLTKREDVCVFSTINGSRVGSMNTTFDKVG